jgi:hypothetical protein
MKLPAGYDEEAAAVSARIPSGARVAVIGSTSFWQAESQQTCADIGEGLSRLDDLVLLTGGVSGVGECVGRGYARGCSRAGRTPAVIHILPRGCGAWDYGTTLLAGDGMGERREILGRLAKVFVVVEGGPGTAHEAGVAAAHGALLVPVGRSGGHAGKIFPTLTRPRFADARAWCTLGKPEAAPSAVATAVVEIVSSCFRHGV